MTVDNFKRDNVYLTQRGQEKISLKCCSNGDNEQSGTRSGFPLVSRKFESLKISKCFLKVMVTCSESVGPPRPRGGGLISARISGPESSNRRTRGIY